MTVEPLSGPNIRSSFINSTKGEATRLTLPAVLDSVPWNDIDFLG
ncbi:FBP domain-containing protein [Rhodococcus sp. 15-649-2-2]|nr:FBP domain-containing protein [Rhodococcus sp. 15-649-2-2]